MDLTIISLEIQIWNLNNTLQPVSFSGLSELYNGGPGENRNDEYQTHLSKNILQNYILY